MHRIILALFFSFPIGFVALLLHCTAQIADCLPIILFCEIQLGLLS